MYRQDLDALKGIAIIAVVLFHMGLLKSGYLGVDAFFVINGFLVIPSVVKRILNSEFSFLDFMEKRVVRLLPLIVLASAVSITVGYFLMLPDHYEGVAQSVIASNLMSENVLSAITTKNYWDVANDYKPLMHLWYVGILFEFYLVMPILLLVADKCAQWTKKKQDVIIYATLAVVSLVSLVLYLDPSVTNGNRFYYLPFRFFELGVGGLIALNVQHAKRGRYLQKLQLKKVAILLLMVVFGCCLYNLFDGNETDTYIIIGKPVNTDTGLPISAPFALLSTVLLTGIVVACGNGTSWVLKSKILAWLGKMSYSIFIWHQVMLAFYRYSVSSEVDLRFSICFIGATLVVSSISYYFVEKKITSTRKTFIAWIIAALLVMLPSGYIYLHAGVVRDVPELDIVKGTEHRGMFSEYCDRVYQYKNFPSENGKPNVLVVGVSFGRDFANILLESEYKDSINLVYAYKWTDKNIRVKVKQADYIFTFSPKTTVPRDVFDKMTDESSTIGVPYFVWDEMKTTCKCYGISTKNYGESNGIIYRNRGDGNYFNQTIQINHGYIKLNDEWKLQWRENYIDLLTPALVDENHVRVFTDDKRFISQDCRHLTQAGAQWYARTLDWVKIFEK